MTQNGEQNITGHDTPTSTAEDRFIARIMDAAAQLLSVGKRGKE